MLDGGAAQPFGFRADRILGIVGGSGIRDPGRRGLVEIGISLPNNRRQHRTLRPEGCAALRIVLVTVPRVSCSCEHCPDGFDLHLLLSCPLYTPDLSPTPHHAPHLMNMHGPLTSEGQLGEISFTSP